MGMWDQSVSLASPSFKYRYPAFASPATSGAKLRSTNRASAFTRAKPIPAVMIGTDFSTYL